MFDILELPITSEPECGVRLLTYSPTNQAHPRNCRALPSRANFGHARIVRESIFPLLAASILKTLLDAGSIGWLRIAIRSLT